MPGSTTSISIAQLCCAMEGAIPGRKRSSRIPFISALQFRYLNLFNRSCSTGYAGDKTISS